MNQSTNSKTDSEKIITNSEINNNKLIRNIPNSTKSTAGIKVYNINSITSRVQNERSTFNISKSAILNKSKQVHYKFVSKENINKRNSNSWNNIYHNNTTHPPGLLKKYNNQMEEYSEKQQSAYQPDVLYKDYLVTFVTGLVGVHLQSPKEQEQHEILKNRLKKFCLSGIYTSISNITENKDKVYCVYHNGTMYRSKAIKPIECTGQKRYLCSDIDSGTMFAEGINNFYELPEDLQNLTNLTSYRMLKNVKVPFNSCTDMKNYKKKIYEYVSEILIGKYITVENPSNYHINIYLMNEYLNPKIQNGIQALLTQPAMSQFTSAANPSPLRDYSRGIASGNQTTLCDIPSSSRKMEILRNPMYTPANKSSPEQSSNSKYLMKNNLLTVTNLISENYKKRQIILEKTGESSVISKASQYILEQSSFYSEVDDLLSKGTELLTDRLRYHRYYSENKIEKRLSDFYMKQHQVNIVEIRTALIAFQKELSTSCTQEDIYRANEQRSKREISDLDQSFHTFIREFHSWKVHYAECGAKTDQLMKKFIEEQTDFIKWTENVLQNSLESSNQFTFDFTQKLYEQLITEEKLSHEESWTTLAVLMTMEEIERRLKKLSAFYHVSKNIDNKFQNCTYQKNKQFLTESNVTLLSFIKPPIHMAAEIKCFFICDVYKELLNYHKCRVVYKMLNPANVLIVNQAQARLRPLSEVDTDEPFPPWQFAAPECYQSASVVTPFADSYSFGQFILWLACVHANKNFDHEMRRIKQCCPIFDKTANDEPHLRPCLRDIERAFVHIFPNAFGVTFSENFTNIMSHSNSYEETKNQPIKVFQPNSRWRKPYLMDIPVTKEHKFPHLKKEANYENWKSKENIYLENSPKCAEAPKTSNGIELEDMKYELSILRELQNSDSDSGDLEEDLASMMSLANH